MDESNVTDEDLELERYGLEQEFPPDSEGSDVEDALYMQVHYNLKNSTGYQTDHMGTVLDSLKGNISSKEGNFLKSCDHDANVEPDLASDSISDFDKDVSDFDDSKYSVGENGKKISNPNSETCINNDDKDVNLCSSTDSGIIIEKTITNTNCAVSKQSATNPVSKKMNAVSAAVSKVVSLVTKINRDDYMGKNKKKRRREKKKGGASDEEAKTAAEDGTIRSDSVSGIEGRSLTTSSKRTKDLGRNRAPDVVRGSVPDVGRSSVPDAFFVDRKGMALDGVKRDLAGAQAGWREERERTKAMLRDRARLVYVVDSSEEEDCMVVESCSEDERMQIHIDNSKSATSDAKLSEVTSGKRKKEGVKVKGRYFVQSMQKNVKCHNCYEIGHIIKECPKPLRIPACILCGMKGHTDKSCPQSLCFNCSLPGHQSRACTQRSTRRAVCFRCNMPGHFKQTCTDHWRQYHMTTKKGSLFKPARRERNPAGRQRDVYCSNCSRKGHRYYDCTAARFDEFTVFTYDEVAEYDRKFKEKPFFSQNEDEGPASKRKRGLPRQECDPAAEEPQTFFGSKSQSKQQDHQTPRHQASHPPKKMQRGGLDIDGQSHRLDEKDLGIGTFSGENSLSQKVISSRKSQRAFVDISEPSVSAVEEMACREDVIEIKDSEEEEEEESGVNMSPVVTQGGQQFRRLTRKEQTSFCRGLRKRGLLFQRKIVNPDLLTPDELAMWEYVERVRKERMERKKRRMKEKIERNRYPLVNVGSEASSGSSHTRIQGGGFVLDRELRPLVHQHWDSRGISVWDRTDGIGTVSGVNSSGQKVISSRKSQRAFVDISEPSVSAVEEMASREDVIEIKDSEEEDEEGREESGVNTLPVVTQRGLQFRSLTRKEQKCFCRGLRKRGLLSQRKLVNPDLLTPDELATWEYVERVRKERIERRCTKRRDKKRKRKEKERNRVGVSEKEMVKQNRKEKGEMRKAKKAALRAAKLQRDKAAGTKVSNLNAGDFPRSGAQDLEQQSMMISSNSGKRAVTHETKRNRSEHKRNCYVS